MVDGSRYIFLLIRLVRRLLRAASGSRRTLFKLNGFQAIRRRFLEDIAEKTTVSPFPFLPPTEKLGALRAASIESHELFSGRGPMSLFGFRQLEWRERKALSFFLDHLRFLICVSQERSYTRSFKEATVAHGVLFREFRVEALVVASSRFTAIIARTRDERSRAF